MLSKEDALYGAAYRVLFDRLDPDGCTTKEKMSKIQIATESISLWIEAQAPDVRSAYARAKLDIVKRAKDILENNERAVQLVETLAALPKPPTE